MNVLDDRSDDALGALLDVLPDALLAVDPAGIVRLANVHAARLFGCTRDELLGAPVDRFVPDDARVRHAAHRAAYAAAPRVRPMGAWGELAARRADGTEFPAEISLGVFDTADGPLYAAAVRDVTERRAAAEERAALRDAATRAEHARERERWHRLESLGLLASGVAHDFTNVLAAIANFAEHVARRLASVELPEEARAALADDVAQIRLAASRGTELTRDLLEYARRDEPSHVAVDPNEVVAALLPMIRRTMPSNIFLVHEPDPRCAPVAVELSGIERVLVNLCVNARDAMPDGGTIRIATTDVLAVDDTGAGVAAAPGAASRHVQIDVVDEGRGMSDEVAARAFDPFFTTKPRGEGTGLGLATVFGIVQAAGGQVTLRSEPGAGTTCTVLLPAAAVRAEAPQEVLST